jgi:hypothetical protein
MLRDKAAARILLVLSVIHVAAAAPATIRQRSLEVTKDLTAALENRADSDESSLLLFSRMDNGLPPTSGTLPSQDVTSPAPGDSELNSDPPAELGTPQLRLDQPPTLGTAQVQDDLPPMPGTPPSQNGPLQASGTLQLQNGQPPTPGAPPSQDDRSSASEDPELHRLHGDQPPGWQHTNWRPPGEMLEGESSGTAEIPPLHDDLSWEHANWRLEETLQGESSVVPPLRDDQRWPSRLNDWHSLWQILPGESSGALPDSDGWSWHGNLAASGEALYDGTWSPMSEPPRPIDDQWGQHVNLASPGETPGMSSTTSGVSDGRLQALGAQWLHHGGSEDVDYLYRRQDDAL